MERVSPELIPFPFPMPGDYKIRVRFWGVRGSLPTPASENLRYGGNTTCLEVFSPGGRFIIDLGSGARNLGLALQKEFGKSRAELSVLMTHFHWDHIQGMPFFAPLYSPLSHITFYSSRPPNEVRNILEGHMATPYYPVRFEYMAAAKQFAGGNLEPFAIGGLAIQPFRMNHPQGATGFRIEYQGKVFVHASDHEHGYESLDRNLRLHARDADLLVMDAQYTAEEYESKRGWGHATWVEAVRVAMECNVKQLVLFHHDPAHTDAFLDDVVAEARNHFANTSAAEEGSAIEI
jgi:phosphoribosyl 1,2-cyclic phosphodiesterase